MLKDTLYSWSAHYSGISIQVLCILADILFLTIYYSQPTLLQFFLHFKFGFYRTPPKLYSFIYIQGTFLSGFNLKFVEHVQNVQNDQVNFVKTSLIFWHLICLALWIVNIA